jgi:hypothetical protein
MSHIPDYVNHILAQSPTCKLPTAYSSFIAFNCNYLNAKNIFMNTRSIAFYDVADNLENNNKSLFFQGPSCYGASLVSSCRYLSQKFHLTLAIPTTSYNYYYDTTIVLLLILLPTSTTSTSITITSTILLLPLWHTCFAVLLLSSRWYALLLLLPLLLLQ